MANSIDRKVLGEKIDVIQRIDPRQIVVGKAASVKPVYQEMMVPLAAATGLFKGIGQTEVDGIPDDLIDKFDMSAGELFGWVTAVLSDLPEGTDPNEEAKQRLHEIQHFHELRSPYISAVRDWMVKSKITSMEYERQARENLLQIEAILAQVDADAKQISQKMQGHLESTGENAKTVERAAEIVRQKSGDVGALELAQSFDRIATQHLNASSLWLLASAVLFVTITVFLRDQADALPLASDKDALRVTAQTILARSPLIGIWVFALVFAVRNYTANRHNFVTNKHRINILHTYQKLVEAAGDQANKDIVLTKASESIFGAQPTGYGKADAEDAGKGVTLVQISSVLPKPGPTG